MLSSITSLVNLSVRFTYSRFPSLRLGTPFLWKTYTHESIWCSIKTLVQICNYWLGKDYVMLGYTEHIVG